MVRKVENNQEYRYERKFLIPLNFYNDLKLWFSNNQFLFKESYSPRQINNIYLDTINFDFFNQNVAGIGLRTKVRIRWYGNLCQTVSPILEIKKKSGLVGKKISRNLGKLNTENLFNHNLLIDCIEKTDFEDDLKFEINKLYPTLVNSYKRNYYESLDKKIRATIDSNLIYYKPIFNYKTKRFQHKFVESSYILELKYSSRDEDLNHIIFDKVPFRLIRNSKYVNGLNATKY